MLELSYYTFILFILIYKIVIVPSKLIYSLHMKEFHLFLRGKNKQINKKKQPLVFVLTPGLQLLVQGISMSVHS